ncbi:MAG: Ig-like domain-containing protein [Kofleriaceae bacterium]
MRRLVCLLLLIGGIAHAEPRNVVLDGRPPTQVAPAQAPYNTIFLNRCASGCSVRNGANDSRADTSDIVTGSHVFNAFPYDDATWTSVVKCVRDVFSPFNVNITDVDPGTANHFEIMVGDQPGDLGFPDGYGGVSTNGCGQTFIPNALVFDFAGAWGTTTCNNKCIENVCATAAQEIAHSFGMDHSHNKMDPMTYFTYALRKYFQNTADQCGSDCVSGKSPSGQTCTGSDSNVHPCCRTAATQNSYQTLINLFGAGTPTPPRVSITKPLNGASVEAGFAVAVNADADSSITMVELYVDGTLVPPAVTTTPYAFTAPSTLMAGNHTVEAKAYDAHGVTNTSDITVVIGPPCTSASECPASTDACIDGRCVPGPSVDGGLGKPCTGAADCVDGQCASNSNNDMYCTEPCSDKGQCPDGFGCLPLADGSPAGVCWPGYDDGSGGGCNTSGAGGPITGGMLFGVLLLVRRRARS